MFTTATIATNEAATTLASGGLLSGNFQSTLWQRFGGLVMLGAAGYVFFKYFIGAGRSVATGIGVAALTCVGVAFMADPNMMLSVGKAIVNVAKGA